MALRACIFDFDGTLGDSMWVWEAVIGEFFQERGVAIVHRYVDAWASRTPAPQPLPRHPMLL